MEVFDLIISLNVRLRNISAKQRVQLTMSHLRVSLSGTLSAHRKIMRPHQPHTLVKAYIGSFPGPLSQVASPRPHRQSRSQHFLMAVVQEHHSLTATSSCTCAIPASSCDSAIPSPHPLERASSSSVEASACRCCSLFMPVTSLSRDPSGFPDRHKLLLEFSSCLSGLRSSRRYQQLLAPYLPSSSARHTSPSIFGSSPPG
jgi:hypothetical protein